MIKVFLLLAMAGLGIAQTCLIEPPAVNEFSA
jgi:hypothetical protein